MLGNVVATLFANKTLNSRQWRRLTVGRQKGGTVAPRGRIEVVVASLRSLNNEWQCRCLPTTRRFAVLVHTPTHTRTRHSGQMEKIYTLNKH